MTESRMASEMSWRDLETVAILPSRNHSSFFGISVLGGGDDRWILFQKTVLIMNCRLKKCCYS
jgi:hypothetical protein